MANDSIPQKRCSLCKQEFPATTEYFRKASKETSGLTSRCKSCLKGGDALYRENNPDHGKEWYEEQKRINPDYNKERYEENKETIIARVAQWQKDNPEKVRGRSKRSYQKHKVVKLAKQKERDQQHPEIKKAANKRYRDSHKEQRNEYNRGYDKLHPERAKRKAANRRARIIEAEGTYTDADILRIFEEQEGRCAYCGITLFWTIPNDIHIDHINPLARGGTNWPDNLQCTCKDCNLSKGDKTTEEWVLARNW